MGKFVLSDLDRDILTGRLKNKGIADNMQKWLGRAVIGAPFEAFQKVDFTSSPGAVMGIYYALLFQLGKWEYLVQKADEWIEVSPAHSQYYEVTQRQKAGLESQIKEALRSVGQAVADLELLLHDLRKYEEFLHYLGYRTKKEHHEIAKKPVPHPMPSDIDEIDFSVDDDKKKSAEREKRVDDHALKAIFIDLVDAHTGDNIAMRSIVSRWPTLISDFMRLSDSDMNPDKVKETLDVTKAEAIVLVTKNKLYVEWKRLFMPEIKARYMRILELVRARRKSTEAYRDWVKPYIARHKLIEEGLSRPGIRSMISSSFVLPVGQAYSSTMIEIWAWKDFQSPEIHKVGSEDISRKPIPVDDDWTMRTLVFNKDQGLIADYPWITKEWVKAQKDDFIKEGWLSKNKIYYSFFQIKLNKTNLRAADGSERENGGFEINLIVMSQNVLFAKLLELKARQQKFEMYVNEMLGVPQRVEGKPYESKYKERFAGVRKLLDYFSLGTSFLKRGPYERDFADRLTKYYFMPISANRMGPILEFVRAKIGLGTA